MMRSLGFQFPHNQLLKGHRHLDCVSNGIYRYQGGDAADILNNWLLVGGELGGHPDTSQWGEKQAGAFWYNKPLRCWFGWNGLQIVSFCVVANPYEGLLASPHDFGSISPGSTSGNPLTLPGDTALYFDTNVNLTGDIHFQFTNPVADVFSGNHTAGTCSLVKSDVVKNQVLEIENLITNAASVDFEIFIDAACTQKIAFGTLLPIF